MLSDVFCVFSKISSFIKRSVEQSKNNECKKRFIIKTSATKVFQVCLSIAYDSFILELSISISISTAMLL